MVGIVGESVFEALQNRAEGQLQTFNDILLADAQRNAGGARASALVAANAASIAVSESDAATASSANAMALARGARKEADSFEREIKSANSTAIAAERHLKDALNDAAEAQAELNRIRTPRSLVNEDGLIAALAKFGGTEYAFSMCFADDESISLLKQIDSALQAAGWKRVAPSPTPAIGLKIFGDKSEDMIAEGTLTGIEISVDFAGPIDSLRATPQPLWPKAIMIAGFLKNELSVSIDPPSDSNVRNNLVIQSGSSTVVRISVGKKP